MESIALIYATSKLSLGTQKHLKEYYRAVRKHGLRSSFTIVTRVTLDKKF